MLRGVLLVEIRKNVDERGFFLELMRQDWKELLDSDDILQANLSMSYPGIIRAWHRHNRGQVDYFISLKGALKVCLYDDGEGSPTRYQLDEIILSSEKLQVLRVPGHYWHGFKAIGNEPAWLLYFVTKLYDYSNPDEERRPWNDPSIIDPRTKQPFDWNRVVFK